ncbi:prolyl oligopeptidase family serine peptidase [Peribacillus deserti]|uniref:Peptidase n=1 Tax=Peribacillus deserti TaxID=673318 RepID=A0A2N5MBU7_9BACI|nr:prolyl oligopeptidase family serine peptidase [Peribacillus deserti]PLT31830.1 peptidase [Peribacillus deserti]
MKKSIRPAMLCMLAVIMAVSLNINASAKQADQKRMSYRTVTEIHDWGAAITKVIVDLGKPAPKGSISEDTFKVHVVRSDSRLSNPFLEEGYRNITKAYISDKNGKPGVRTGKYAVLEMEIGPSVSLGSPLNYYAGSNAWVDSKYTVTQQKDIAANGGAVSGLVADQFSGGTRELVDDFATGKETFGDKTLTYASYSPEKDKTKNPLIIWLHGGGEGGADPSIPLSANKAVSFATEETQSYFNGAYVLVPQAPTRWMHGFTGRADGTSIYEEALMGLIKDYISKNPDIDPSRIYIGGASNGGYMTMLMIRDYPGYFAAAFPICEGLNDRLVTDADIQKIKETPTWFVTSKNDTTLPPKINTLPTYERLVKAGAKDVHLTLFNGIFDHTGLYKNADGTPYEYNGHFSWVPLYNNDVETAINEKTITIMEWLAAQSLNK